MAHVCQSFKRPKFGADQRFRCIECDKPEVDPATKTLDCELPAEPPIRPMTEARERALQAARTLGWDAADRVIRLESAPKYLANLQKLDRVAIIGNDEWTSSYVDGYRDRGNGEPRP